MLYSKSNRSKITTNHTATLFITYLAGFLHNRIPLSITAWAVDNLTPLDMLFLSIIA